MTAPLRSRCRWIYDQDVPDGRFLVPGCWNRAVHGDDADCQCDGGEVTIHEEVQLLRSELSALRAEVFPGLEADRMKREHPTKENTKESLDLRKSATETRPQPVQEQLL